MDTFSPHTGFTRKELTLAIGLLCMGISCFALAQEPAKAGADLAAAVKKARAIHTLLTAWAQDNDQAYPAAPQFSNEAFRELFKRRLVDNEDVFAIPGDAWHKNSTSGTGPDGNYGTAPEFAEALASGECAFAYVSGLDTPSSSRTPLIANAFSHSVGVYSKSTSQKGGVFGGTKSFYVSVGGSAHTVDLSSDCKVMVKYGPRILDVFSNDFGTNPDDVKNPL